MSDRSSDIARPRLEPLWRLLRDPLGATGFALVALMVLSAIGADILAPFDPRALDVPARLEGPSLTHWLGTDNLGRDTFSRVIHGGRIALQVSLIAVGTALLLGLTFGMMAGFGPKWLDQASITVFDTILSFPLIMFALAVVTLVGAGLWTIILVVIVISAPSYARIVRTQTLVLKEADFIMAERAMGAGTLRIMFSHILPNVIGPLLIMASMDIPVVIAVEASLSFIGLGSDPSTPSWGNLLADGYNFIRHSPWIVIGGGIPLVLTTLGFTFLGETLRDIFDPKLRGDD